MAPLPQEKAQRPERRAQGSARSDPVSLSSLNYLLLNTLSSFSPLGLCAWNILPLIRLTYSHSSGIGNGFTCDKASLTPTSPKTRLVTSLMGVSRFCLIKIGKLKGDKSGWGYHLPYQIYRLDNNIYFRRFPKKVGNFRVRIVSSTLSTLRTCEIINVLLQYACYQKGTKISPFL